MLNDMASNGWMYMKTEKGMPGLKETDKIINDNLKVHMKTHGYSLVLCTPILWRHKTRPINTKN